MKKMALIALTPGGAGLARNIKQVIENNCSASCCSGDKSLAETIRKLSLSLVDIFLPPGLVDKGDKELPATSLQMSFNYIFKNYDYMACIMSTGIAVRMLASLLENKYTDPGIVVLDEKGRHAISLVGGHRSGANDLSRLLACCTGGEEVITTATDVLNRPHLEQLATDFYCRVEPPGLAEKAVNAALASGEKIFLFYEEELPPGFPCSFFHPLPLEKLGSEPGRNTKRLFITNRLLPAISRAGNNYFLRPRNLAAGVGCRRGIGKEYITSAVIKTLHRAGYSPLSLKVIASADIKKEESGLLKTANELGAETVFFSPQELEKATIDSNLKSSNMAKKHLGLKGVSQPAALLAAKSGKLLLSKQVIDGVTVALAVIPGLQGAASLPGPGERMENNG